MMDDHTTWSRSDLYTVTADTTDQRCIAPNVSGDRCGSQWLDAASRQQLQTLHTAILRSTDARDIVRKMLQLVLIRCNTFGDHRDKLAARPICHREVAERYLDQYTNLSLLRVSVPRGLDVENEASIAAGQLEPFVPKSQESLEAVLKRSLLKIDNVTHIRVPYTRTGVVYAFTSSAWPNVVKIGYSGISAQSRMDALWRCMPNGRIAIEERFEFPERMEELIHLELLSQRRKVVRCKTCSLGHQEFFELPVGEIRVLFEEWRWIVEKEPLYDVRTESLTNAWQRRLEALTVPATAWGLKKVLEQEDEARRAQRAQAEREQQAREQQAREERERQARAEKEQRARAEREQRARVERENQARAERENQARVEKERQARVVREKRARELRAQVEREERAQVEREQRARAEAEVLKKTAQREQQEKSKTEAAKSMVLAATFPPKTYALRSKEVLKEKDVNVMEKGRETKQDEANANQAMSSRMIQSQADSKKGSQPGVAKAMEHASTSRGAVLAKGKTKQSASSKEGLASTSISLKKLNPFGNEAKGIIKIQMSNITEPKLALSMVERLMPSLLRPKQSLFGVKERRSGYVQ